MDLNLLKDSATELEVRTAISELSPPGPKRIARLLGVPNPKQNKLANLHEIMDFAPLSEVIEMYNDIQLVKVGRMKVFKDFFSTSIQWLQNIFPFIQKAIKMLEDGKITIEELEDLLHAKENNNLTIKKESHERNV